MASPYARITATNLSISAGLALVGLVAGSTAAFAQESGYGQTLGTYGNEQPREPFDDDSGGLESILDATNPLELLNRIRRGTALDDATPPSSAIDAALREFEAQGGAEEALIPPATSAASPETPTAGGAPSNQNSPSNRNF